mmetsp:Transcript_12870/g.32945  ORF Transcript_12870/g.32945 Transcript_12870/m.32945 type:complete len:82 (-) Transcript_12870:149-394(-)
MKHFFLTVSSLLPMCCIMHVLYMRKAVLQLHACTLYQHFSWMIASPTSVCMTHRVLKAQRWALAMPYWPRTLLPVRNLITV